MVSCIWVPSQLVMFFKFIYKLQSVSISDLSTSPRCAMDVKAWLRDISVPVYFLAMTFSTSAWLDMNAIIAELPVLVNRVPEGWNLGSYLFVSISAGNIGMFTYAAIKRCLGDKVREMPVVYAIISVGTVGLLLLAFFWDRTLWLWGAERSFALLFLSSCLGFVDNMSSVVFIPYMARFKSQYVTAFFLGEACSAVIPAGMGVLQGIDEKPLCLNTTVTENVSSLVNGSSVLSNQTLLPGWKITPLYPTPKFSVANFFIVTCLLMCASGVAFTLLHFLPYCRRAHTTEYVTHTTADISTSGKPTDLSPLTASGKQDMAAHKDSDRDQGKLSLLDNAAAKPDVELMIVVPERPMLTPAQFVYLLLLVYLGFFVMYGISPGVYTYAALPYGDRAYNLGVRLSMAMNPIGTILSLLAITRSLRGLGVLTLIGLLLGAYEVYLAAFSPEPPLVGTTLGEALVVSMTVVILTRSKPKMCLNCIDSDPCSFYCFSLASYYCCYYV